jgi:hypothetical protein
MDILKHINEQIDTRLPAGDMSGIKLRECQWTVKTAGPSPFNNERTELFLLGCNKAMSGNPCQGCFNSSTWDASKAQWTHDPVKMAEHINRNAPNKYITIGGGEPTDQIENLIILCRELKKYDFHIMIYTWRDLKEIVNMKDFALNITPIVKQNFIELLKYVDIVVDGQFKIEEKLWDGTKEDGLISSIGSGNQIVWDIKTKHGYRMKDLGLLQLIDNEVHFFVRAGTTEMFELEY